MYLDCISETRSFVDVRFVEYVSAILSPVLYQLMCACCTDSISLLNYGQ